MPRTKLCNRSLPDYTRGEEIFNMVSHIVGGGFGIIALVTCVCVAAYYHNGLGILSGAIYGVTMIILYTMSSVYHGLTPPFAKKVMQVIDHCSIYLLISGTYTPLTLGPFMKSSAFTAWLIFGIVWGLAILGITLNAIDLKQYRVFSMICYLGMGWCIIFVIKPLLEALSTPGFALLLIGGVFYTLGAVLYGIGKKKRYMHSVFHLFVVLGSIFQYFCILLYIMPGGNS